MKTSLKMLALTTVLFAGGCATENVTEESYFNKFVPDDAPRRVQDLARTQTAVGDREDGTLYAWHFDGKDLSPLGREKLSYIVDADSNEPIVIHMDVKTETFAERKKSVVAFLQDQGVANSHMNVIEGVNDAKLYPAAPGLAAYAKTDTSVESSGGYNSTSNTASAK